MHFRRLCLLCVVATTLLAAGTAHAHPFHVSLAEAEFNAERQVLEVALRLHPIDLEKSLERISGKRVALEDDGIDQQILAWLKRSFIVHAQDGTQADMKWIGKEVSVKHAWLYFEIPLPGGIENVAVANRIFFELLPDQVNTVNLRDGDRKTTLHFTRAKSHQRLVFDEHGETSAP